MPVWYNDAIDDPILLDGQDDWSGGQFSFARARQVRPNQAKSLKNFVISIIGELRGRHGIKSLGGDGTVGTAASRIQSLIFFDRVLDDRLLAFTQGKCFEFSGGT